MAAKKVWSRVDVLEHPSRQIPTESNHEVRKQTLQSCCYVHSASIYMYSLSPFCNFFSERSKNEFDMLGFKNAAVKADKFTSNTMIASWSSITRRSSRSIWIKIPCSCCPSCTYRSRTSEKTWWPSQSRWSSSSSVTRWTWWTGCNSTLIVFNNITVLQCLYYVHYTVAEKTSLLLLQMTKKLQVIHCVNSHASKTEKKS